MRQVTRDIVSKFLDAVPACISNSQVVVYGTDVYLLLHGNQIAKRCLDTGRVFISNAGWESVTTKERLNGVLEFLGKGKIYQCRGVWYLAQYSGEDIEFPHNEWLELKGV